MCLWHTHPNATCAADGTRTATVGNGDLVRRRFCWAALGHAAACLRGVSGAKNNGGSRNYALSRFDDDVVR